MKKTLEEKIESLQLENVVLERKIERLKMVLLETNNKMQANTRAMEVLAEVLEETPEEKVLIHQTLHRRPLMKVIIMDYARTRPNEVIHSDDFEKYVVSIWGQPLGTGTLTTYLGKLIKDGSLKRVEPKKYIYTIPGETPKEVPFTPTGARTDSKKVVLEVMRSHANEAMKTMQIEEAIKQKYPALHISRDVIWFHLNKTLAPMGLIKKVSPGTYQYELPKNELKEEDSFAVGGD